MALKACGAARHQDAVLVNGNNVLGTSNLQHVDDGRTGSTGAVLHNFNILDALAHYFQGVEHTGQHDDSGAVLVIVENGNVQVALQFGFDLEALGAADVLQVDAAESRGNGLDGRDNFLFGLGVQADGERVHAAKLLEQHTLALHDRQAGFGADVAQAQHGGAVGHNGHSAAFHRVGVYVIGVGLDLAAGLGHAGGVGGGQGIAVFAGGQALHGDLAGIFAVKFQGSFVVIHDVYLVP